MNTIVFSESDLTSKKLEPQKKQRYTSRPKCWPQLHTLLFQVHMIIPGSSPRNLVNFVHFKTGFTATHEITFKKKENIVICKILSDCTLNCIILDLHENLLLMLQWLRIFFTRLLIEKLFPRYSIIFLCC